MLVAHVERAGVCLVEGGMQRLAEALAALATARGVRIRCHAPVHRIDVQHGAVRGVTLANAERLEGDAVVFNGDTAALAHGLLGEAARAAVPRSDAQAPRSLSAVTWHAVARTRGFPLSHHNVFFGGNYRAEFRALFEQRCMPLDPTVYVCAQDRGASGSDAADAPRTPGGEERLMCLVNAPAVASDGAAPEVKPCHIEMLRSLERCGLTLEPAGPPCVTTPTEFARLFPGSSGALYGAATHGWQASFRRPGSRSRLPGLYLAGGTTHPGPGVPMAALSGRLAAQALLSDRKPARFSMHGWQPAATPGGTSMP